LFLKDIFSKIGTPCDLRQQTPAILAARLGENVPGIAKSAGRKDHGRQETGSKAKRPPLFPGPGANSMG
jgi:hypothetical protein